MEIIKPQIVQMPIIDKVFATHQCIWCNRKFDGYQISCQYCHNCQYCGMVGFGMEHCQNCGNHVDDELKRDDAERETVIFSE